MKDYYSILGVSSSASYTEIRKAYKRLALELHPDVNNSATAKEDFIEIHEAYKVLKNVRSRKHYDRLYVQYTTDNKNQRSSESNRKQKKWSENQKRRSNTGRKKGETESRRTNKEYKKRSSWWRFGDVLAFLVDLLSIFG